MMGTTTAQTRGSRHWMRTVLLTAGFALLVASAPQPAAAADQDPMAAATNQAQACEALGGEAKIDVHRTPAGGKASAVVCKGGMADGVNCYNDTKESACYHPDVFVDGSTTGEHVSPVGGIEVPEDGPSTQASAALAAFQAQLASVQAAADQAQPASGQGSVTAGDDREHDQDTKKNKGKKSKKGKKDKKGGKGRGK